MVLHRAVSAFSPPPPRGPSLAERFLEAASVGDLATVRQLLQADPSLAGARGHPVDFAGQTPLMAAASAGQVGLGRNKCNLKSDEIEASVGVL
jgi:ankyrin repeat protein